MLASFRSLALALLLTGAAGCATFDEVEGVPDSRRYSYFLGTPAEVVEATRRTLTLNGYTVVGISGSGGVTVLSVSTDPPRAADGEFTEIRVEPVAVRDYRARAQTGPRGRRLPLDLERAISAEL